MAILAMDQYAELVAERLANAVRVTAVGEIAAALDSPAPPIPVLAPSAWIRAADPLPHSWDVTSDSIAAWVAGQVRATHLVLVKPAGAAGRELVDPYFRNVVPEGIKPVIVPADRLDLLSAELMSV
jgi:aspartokinase-like uncharacterized kinase